MNKLLSLPDYIDWIQEQGNNSLWILDKIITRNDIGKMEPRLWMFIPCNEKGEPMEELGKPDYFLEYRGKGKPIASHNKRVEYQKAKARCWFKGWILKEFTHPKRKGIQNSNKDGIILKEMSSQTIESLITSRMELTITETLIKKLGI